jgi:hypothetical protein
MSPSLVKLEGPLGVILMKSNVLTFENKINFLNTLHKVIKVDNMLFYDDFSGWLSLETPPRKLT